MSRALDYLLKARPTEMGAYFAFLKDAGSRLDPKTRALISVITKVAVQTDKGLIQYTRKALAVGASADEVLDALMMAFPALGLSRIVWAIDILLASDIDGFSDEVADTDAIERLDLIELEHLAELQTVKIYQLGRSVLLYRAGDVVRAFKAYCSHQGMELMDSNIAGQAITCAQHGWRFEMPNGTCARGERWALSELPVEIIDGRVVVQWRE
jgi:nitrite reductase/ring-hydroxylating ferredoxin subunit/alkylhydroperoxidase/carboxymuconolactone decarboxylase family protein YurZ